VHIRVLVPGKNTDSDAARHASKADWGPMLKAGIEIYEYEPTMFHNKMLIVDKLLVSVGSTNFDLRSFRLNDEASLNVYDAGFADRMTAVYEDDLKRGKQYTFETWEKRPTKEKFMEKFVLPIKSQL
jgi:cardiolipin synthase A/B